MGKRKQKEKLMRSFGAVPDPYYFHGDMEYIRAYYEFRRDSDLDDFLIDDITWNDLDVDRVFKRLNPGLSTSGEQYLYYMLRSPTIKQSDFTGRKNLIDLVEKKADLRLKLQLILSRLGCTRRTDLNQAFHPSAHGFGWLLIYLFLMLLVPAALISISLVPHYGAPAMLAVAVFNILIHELRIHKIQREFDTVNYSVAMIIALHRIQKLKDPALDKHLTSAYESLNRLHSVIRIGGLSRASYGTAGDFIASLLLMDLIAYEFLKNKFSRSQNDIFIVHEHLGKIDAAISIASYRKSLTFYTDPELDFSVIRSGFIDTFRMVHPMLKNPVPNDLLADHSVLITGSNASGKSTYLKTAALCAIMAQSICTCTAKKYHASAFRIYSSMALNN